MANTPSEALEKLNLETSNLIILYPLYRNLNCEQSNSLQLFQQIFQDYMS